MKNIYRAALRIAVLAATVVAFTWYLSNHQQLLRLLGRTPLHVITVLVLLYIVWFGALALTVHATLRLCRNPLALGEHLLLNAYSTLVNFFVPGQGGLAVRGLYLKKQHGLRLKNYVLASLVYYMFYAIVSALMLLVTSRPWWQTALGLLLVGLGSHTVVRWYERRSMTRSDVLDLGPANLGFLLVATMIQAVVQVAIYFCELRSVSPHIDLSQAVTYTGAANFSLFVALTPGAIGIRESFLLFSQQLHHVATASIVAASVIDRAAFLILLGLLGLLTLVFHAKRALKIG